MSESVINKISKNKRSFSCGSWYMKVRLYRPGLWRGCSWGLGIAALRRWCETWAADTGKTENGTLASQAGRQTEKRVTRTNTKHSDLKLQPPAAAVWTAAAELHKEASQVIFQPYVSSIRARSAIKAIVKC